ncbi:hypothetical protein ACFLY7_01035 [Patescibacteria group bacterium]
MKISEDSFLNCAVRDYYENNIPKSINRLMLGYIIIIAVAKKLGGLLWFGISNISLYFWLLFAYSIGFMFAMRPRNENDRGVDVFIPYKKWPLEIKGFRITPFFVTYWILLFLILFKIIIPSMNWFEFLLIIQISTLIILIVYIFKKWLLKEIKLTKK